MAWKDSLELFCLAVDFSASMVAPYLIWYHYAGESGARVYSSLIKGERRSASEGPVLSEFALGLLKRGGRSTVRAESSKFCLVQFGVFRRNLKL
jgi:hypothetical protein